MATYKTYAELKDKVLKSDDKVFLKGTIYKVCASFLSGRDGHNDQIFDQLKIDKNEVAKKCYGYEPGTGIWPESDFQDYAALTRLVLYLFKKIENSPEIHEDSQRICYVITWQFANAHAEKLREYFDKSTEISNSYYFDGKGKNYYWYSDEKIMHWGSPTTLFEDKITIIDSELYNKLIKPNLKSTINENRFQNKKPQISRGIVPGGSIIRGRKGKTSIELGHLSYRTVSCE